MAISSKQVAFLVQVANVPNTGGDSWCRRVHRGGNHGQHIMRTQHTLFISYILQVTLALCLSSYRSCQSSSSSRQSVRLRDSVQGGVLHYLRAPSNAVRIFMAQIQLSSRPRPFHWFGLVSESPFGDRWPSSSTDPAPGCTPTLFAPCSFLPRGAPRYLPGLYRESISQSVIQCQ